MKKESILVVDDEEDILELVRYNLTREGYPVTCAATGEDALRQVRADAPDLLLLDLMLPGVDGLSVARMLKENPETRRIPIIMLTARGEEADIVVGLEMGADDYITKPFSLKILTARVRAVLRRAEKENDDSADGVIRVGAVCVDPGRRKVDISGEEVTLSYTEFQILRLLARRPGWVYTRSQIVDNVHGESYPVTERSVDVQIVGLRKKLGACGGYIETVRGVGYRFKEMQ